MKKSLLIFLLTMSSTLFSQSRIYVDINATGNKDGTSWADAFTSLNAAISAGSNGDTVWMANGIYKPGVNNIQSFDVNRELKIYGGFAGNETQLSQRDYFNNLTILSGDLAGDDINSNFPFNLADASRDDNSNRIMNVYANSVVLDGLVIRGGHSRSASCSGIYIHSSVNDFIITNCEISLNYSYGINAGVMMAIEQQSTNIEITNNRFQYNQSNTATGFYLFTNDSITANITIANNQFLRQRIEPNGNYFSGAAGWVRAFNPASTVNFTFANNTISKSVIATPNVGGRIPTILGISLGSANTSGAMNSEIVNNIFWDNEDGAANNPVEVSSVINNGTSFGTVLRSNPNIAPEQLSILPGNPGINSDPLFSNSRINDFSLTPSSPALNTGNNSFVSGQVDLLGNPRVSGLRVDLGAIEFQSATSIQESISGDKNLIIYPNPTAGIINIDSEFFSSVEVYSITGEYILQSNSSKFDIRSQPAGVYVLKILSDDNQFIYKQIVKE